MSFAFGIGGDDIELDTEEVQTSSEARHAQVASQDKSATPVKCYLIGDGNPQDEPTRSLLCCLPSTISYECVEVTSSAEPLTQISTRPSDGTVPDKARSIITVLRRPTYDVLLQLKAEANPEINQNGQLISSMEGNDREAGIYEGGLKTWEGALDLAGHMLNVNLHQGLGNWHIIELGAGSAIPSMVALQTILAINTDADLTMARKRFHFTLSDYNDEVLRFSTFANILLASKRELDHPRSQELLSEIQSEGFVDVDETLIHDCCELWRQAGISFSFVSGPWSKEFGHVSTASVAESFENVLILASETIYDPKSLPVFTDMVVYLLRAHRGSSKAWVAAKKLYFGVGGGVDAFVQEVEARGASVREIMETKQGISRVVLEVTMTKEQ